MKCSPTPSEVVQTQSERPNDSLLHESRAGQFDTELRA